jgi:tetratricopeptide (TPR) repeat protein
MSEEISLPPGFLPRERHYRSGSTDVAAVIFLIVLVPSWHVSKILSHLSLWWAMNVEDWYVVVAVVVAFVFFVARRNRELHLGLQEDLEAVALLEAGRTAEAARRLDALCRRFPRGLPYHAMVVYNRGVAFLREGYPDRALSLFAAVLETRMFAKPRHSFNAFYPLLLDGVALAYAIRGETAEAERWHGLAHEQVSSERSASLLVVDVYLGTRAGRNEVVVKDAEAALAGAGWVAASQTQAVRVLCAFALSQKNPNNVRDAEIRRFLDGAWPCQPGQFNYLAVKWPELRTFLEENGLGSVPKRFDGGCAARTKQSEADEALRRSPQADA